MVENLDPVVFLVLDRVKAHIKFRERLKVFNVTQLKNLLNTVKAQVQEAKAGDVLETSEELNVVTAQIQSPQEWKVGETSDLLEGVFSEVEFLKVDTFDILNLGDLVLVEG
jgi:hypothetical protein